ncbi:ABC transporter ATP-binding protein [Paenibacillus tundrae]|uniref:Iron(III) transport system ATP-binding protein/putative spermidine/putrescine transport system ATP-binding protein n=1 Tax=Paenibacillus tundrae TaxID=528187 RepID=A0ABT9W895_9BACL|nr:ABC transporter ATP-binding protein [Paenibacillus tundrae]MDQ0169355.1 iron(III) transport system ATP-binding protein/putative spermidine/putrescine transport system ATP-binding protein [Paenibacillus tundrae]
MKPILKLEGVHKSFDKQEVLRPLSFEMNQGERICILGPSGCGKSTLLQLIAGLLTIDGGIIEMGGKPVDGKKQFIPPEKRPVNMVFQDYALWPHMTVRQNIEYGMKRSRTDSSVRKQRLDRLQSMLQLEGLLDRLPTECSGGQQQRIGMARALATEPSILLMDEPLSNLDVKLRTEMRSELASLLSDLDTTALYVTHDMLEAFTLADRIMVLRAGGIDQFAEPHQLFSRPKTPWVAQLMGYHNRLSTEFTMDGSATHIAEEYITGQMMDRGALGGRAIVMSHPEQLRISMKREERESNQIPVIVKQSIFEGIHWRVIMRTRDNQLIQAFNKESLEPGSECWLHLSPKQTMIYPESAEYGNG